MTDEIQENEQGLVEITATNTKTGEEATAHFDFGGNLDGAVAKYGAEVVYSRFVAKAVIDAQNFMRTLLKKGATTEEAVAKLLAEWKPGAVRRSSGPRKDPLAKAKEKFAAMSPEERAKFLEELEASLQ